MELPPSLPATATTIAAITLLIALHVGMCRLLRWIRDGGLVRSLRFIFAHEQSTNFVDRHTLTRHENGLISTERSWQTIEQNDSLALLGQNLTGSRLVILERLNQLLIERMELIEESIGIISILVLN